MHEGASSNAPKSILFFSPAANIWEHSFPEALLAEALRKEGHEVKFLRCRGSLMPLCPAAQAAGLQSDTPSNYQRRLCASCHSKGRLLDSTLSFESTYLDDIVDSEDNKLVDLLIYSTNTRRHELSSIESYSSIRVNELPVGIYALYDLILRYKKINLILSDEEWLDYLSLLKSATLSAIGAKKLIDNGSFDAFFVYNSLYSAHRPASQIAVRHGLRQYFMHGGTNMSRQKSTLMVGRDYTWHYLQELVSRFHNIEEVPINSKCIESITDHLLALVNASSTYVFSTPASVSSFNAREAFQVSPSQSLLVACTSSYDERFAVESTGAGDPPKDLLFPTIAEWLTELVRIVGDRPEWFLLIRVHPREFPNARGSVTSEHAKRLKELFATLPTNVRVNWPDERISIYDLAKETDVFLTAWSSVGKEMAALGIPVVAYSQKILNYPPSLNRVASSIPGYVAAIEDSIKEGWSFDRVRKAFRWYALEFDRSEFDLTTSYRPDFRYSKALWARAALKVARTIDPLAVERYDLRRRKPMPRMMGAVGKLVSEALETGFDAKLQEQFDGDGTAEDLAMRQALKRVSRRLFGGEHKGSPSKLHSTYVRNGI